MAEIYARGLVNQGEIPPGLGLPRYGGIFTITPRPDLDQGIADIRVAWKDRLLTIRANTDKYNRSNAYGSLEICHKMWGPEVTHAHQTLEQFGHPGTATSISIK
jgi:hypothetical protein